METFEAAMGAEKRRHKNRWRAERRAEAMAQLQGFYRRSDIAAILGAQQTQCYYCGSPLDRSNTRRDHLYPVNMSRSSNWPSNIVLACHPCNRDKSDMSPKAFWRVIERRLGSVWVKVQQERNLAVTALAKELTKRRKEENRSKAS